MIEIQLFLHVLRVAVLVVTSAQAWAHSVALVEMLSERCGSVGCRIPNRSVMAGGSSGSVEL